MAVGVTVGVAVGVAVWVCGRLGKKFLCLGLRLVVYMYMKKLRFD